MDIQSKREKKYLKIQLKSYTNFGEGKVNRQGACHLTGTSFLPPLSGG